MEESELVGMHIHFDHRLKSFWEKFDDSIVIFYHFRGASEEVVDFSQNVDSQSMFQVKNSLLNLVAKLYSQSTSRKYPYSFRLCYSNQLSLRDMKLPQLT